MGKSLFKEGKRRCYVCKTVKTLDNFYKKKNSEVVNSKTWRFSCISCKNYDSKNKFRNKFIREKGNKCEKCLLYNENPTFFDVDHIDSSLKVCGRGSAKSSERDNLQVLCPNCHRLKGLANGEVGITRKSRGL